ncbi:Arc family DNA-binding protein [Pseudomonas sp. MSSRFD41]|uniref:Arc family DNA-binding protein n=1 Tax=Pseudomonas sp. MSSRFD41 TaxID=1310370 RepID=UPI00163B47E6|nr:Arc family DNA-binding protein [Pseudomonas sp. MSSRFD41]MBC2659869.1 Arc family DNA-binding protein [Pseudomonas sp. MSSRFD41]
MRAQVQKFIVRLPDDLHAQVKRVARQENRSMNHEIVDRLEKSLANDDVRHIDDKLVALLLRRVEFLERQIEALQKTSEESKR